MADVANENGTLVVLVVEPDNGLQPGRYSIHFWHNLAGEAQLGVYTWDKGRLVGFVHNYKDDDSTWFPSENAAMEALSNGARVA